MDNNVTLYGKQDGGPKIVGSAANCGVCVTNPVKFQCHFHCIGLKHGPDADLILIISVVLTRSVFVSL